MNTGRDDRLNIDLIVLAAHQGTGVAYTEKLLPSLAHIVRRVGFAGWDRTNKFPKALKKGDVHYSMIFRGWGYSNKRLAVAYPLWVVVSFVYLMRTKSHMVYAIDLDSALPACLASIMTRRRFIYDIRDEYMWRPTLPAFLRPLVSSLDKWVRHRAEKVIIADENRIAASEEPLDQKHLTIYNSSPDFFRPTPARSRQGPEPSLTVLAMGYLVSGRGIHQLLEAARKIPKLKVELAGIVLEGSVRKDVESTPNASFRGWLSQEETMALCQEVDAVFSFYDPSAEINRRAASGKWYDAMMAGKPIITNLEVLKSDWVLSHEIGFACHYKNVDELVTLLEFIRTHPEESKRRGMKGRRLYESGFSWAAMEARLSGLMREVASQPA